MQDADHIAIPLLDGTYALAQIAQVEGDNVVLFLTHRTYRDRDTVSTIAPKDVMAIVPVSLSALPKDHWRILGYDAVPDLNRTKTDFASEDITLHDPAIIEAFANAIHGLYPWDGFPYPAFFTNLLRRSDTVPPPARMTADFPAPDVSE